MKPQLPKPPFENWEGWGVKRFEGPQLFKGRLFVYYLAACTFPLDNNCRVGKIRARCQQKRRR